MQPAYMLVVDHVAERRQAVVDMLIRLRAEHPLLPEPWGCALPGEAVAFSSGHECPIVFTAADLPGMNGFGLIRQIRLHRARTNFILLADHEEYLFQALTLKLRLSGAILGSPDPEALRHQLDDLRYPLPS